MGSELLNTALRSSIFLFTTIGIILQITHIFIVVLRPFFIRSVNNISLKRTQDLYFSGYIFLKNMILYISIAIYLAVIILVISGNSFSNVAFITLWIGTFILFLYVVAKIFIDYSKNIIFSGVALGVIGISLLLNLVTYIQMIVKF